jgi:hypothetical protein
MVVVLQFRCASESCGATWRILPLFLARHIWHTWKAVEQAVAPRAGDRPTSPSARPVRARTKARWRGRLASSARVLVVLLAMSGGTVLEKLAMQVGLLGTRGELALTYDRMVGAAQGERLSTLGAMVHRLERGLRLM